MSDLPYMPLYVADYVGDTSHLTTLEHGAYLLLLFTYWMRQKPLPDDPVKLQRIAKVTPEEWAAMSGTLAEFFQVVGGVWSHKRVEAELTKAKDKLEKATSAGKASAEARRNKRSTPVEQTPSGGSTPVEQTINHRGKVRLSSLETSSRERDARANFLKFWENWPHKVNRNAAETAFARADAPLETILEGVARYVAGRAVDQQWPDPAKWLDGKRWLDQPAPRAVRTAKPQSVAGNSISGKRRAAAERGEVYVMRDTPAGDAWAKFAKETKMPFFWDREGGRAVASEFPPSIEPESQNAAATHH